MVEEVANHLSGLLCRSFALNVNEGCIVVICTLMDLVCVEVIRKRDMLEGEFDAFLLKIDSLHKG